MVKTHWAQKLDGRLCISSVRLLISQFFFRPTWDSFRYIRFTTRMLCILYPEVISIRRNF